MNGIYSLAQLFKFKRKYVLKKRVFNALMWNRYYVNNESFFFKTIIFKQIIIIAKCLKNKVIKKQIILNLVNVQSKPTMKRYVLV